MEVIAWVLVDLYATCKYRHLHACSEVGWSEDDGFKSWACCTDFFNVDESTRCFNLRFNTDVANWQTCRNFYLAKQHVSCHNLRCRFNLWQHDFIKALTRIANNFNDVVGSPLSAPVVHTNAQHLVAPVVAANCSCDLCA